MSKKSNQRTKKSKKEPISKTLVQSINHITGVLLAESLADSYNWCTERSDKGITDISVPNNKSISFGLRNEEYQNIYTWFLEQQVYNYKLLDGALIQMMYRCDQHKVLKHRLAFYPSPFLEAYSEEPILLEEDHIYAEFLQRKTAATPLRFDYSSKDEDFIAVDHPRSHLTIGEYTDCRIPVCSPIDPHSFVDFIIRYFYNKAHKRIGASLAGKKSKLPECIAPEERKAMHLVVGIY